MDLHNETICNLTAYVEWYSTQLDEKNGFLSLEKLRIALLDIDREDVEAWRIMDFDSGAKRDDFVELYSGRRPKQLNLSTGETMELSTVWCDEGLNGLRFEIAGGHG